MLTVHKHQYPRLHELIRTLDVDIDQLTNDDGPLTIHNVDVHGTHLHTIDAELTDREIFVADEMALPPAVAEAQFPRTMAFIRDYLHTTVVVRSRPNKETH